MLYRDSRPALKICAAKTWDSLWKYSYSWKKPKMCRVREVVSPSSHPLRTPLPSIRVMPTPADATSASSQNESKGLRISPAKGSP